MHFCIPHFILFIYFFWCYFTRDISETWIPLVFIFSWFWPPLYYLFHVFSMVNIYKTLNKLFKIAFHNLPLHALRMRGTERRGIVIHPVSQSMRIHCHKRIKGPWFSGLLLSFFIPHESCRFGDLQRESMAEWTNSCLKYSFTSTSFLPDTPSHWTSMFRISFPSTPQWTLKNISFWRAGLYDKDLRSQWNLLTC